MLESPIDVSLDEAILKDGDAAGYISSGGYAHHVGKSMAMGYIATEDPAAVPQLDVEILGETRATNVLDETVYDPQGSKMRS